MTRRDCMKMAAALAVAGTRRASAARKMDFKLGAMQGCLAPKPGPEMFDVAQRVGLQGVELNIGRALDGGKMPLSDPELRKQYMEAARRNKQAIAGVVLDVLHPHPLKDDPAAPAFIPEGIAIARDMKAGVLLLPFFGKGALANRDEMARIADIVKEHAGAARKAGIVMGLENTISAEDNAWIVERIASPAVLVYYDVGNSTNNGFDAPKEIRFLGGKRICQIHIKDRGYMGEGKVDFPECFRAIRDSGYRGWLNFETSSPSKDREADIRRNIEFTRKTLKAVEAEG
jgi:L-ribulose-5-phosphate 3-epimerase